MSDNKHTGNISPEFALLGFLIVGPSHGYDLHQRFMAELTCLASQSEPGLRYFETSRTARGY